MSTLITKVPGTKTAGTTTYKYTPTVALDKFDTTYIPVGISREFKIVTNSDGAINVSSSNTNIFTVALSGKNITVTAKAQGSAKLIVKINPSSTYFGISNQFELFVSTDIAVRYGYRINKNDSNPSTRVEYLYDATGFTPAAMNFSTGVFDYGSWADKWFVTGNKPCMLKSNGTVGYYLKADDYTKKEDGTASDVANTSYDGNAMAQIPLCWVKRWEDTNYEYEVVSNVKYDADYHAYAHTKANGNIADYFYYSMFGGSLGNASGAKMRSLSGQTLASSLTATQEITCCKANNSNTSVVNGSGWYTHTWSQRELIRTLLILMGKSTNTQNVFGTGNIHGGGETDAKMTGTLNNKGQFWGSSENNFQVKVFHIEKFWGDEIDRVAGVLFSGSNGSAFVKMTPEDAGYKITDVTGYRDIGIVNDNKTNGYITKESVSEYGSFPIKSEGSDSTYYSDFYWGRNSDKSGNITYLVCGAGVTDGRRTGGAFAFNSNILPSNYNWGYNCGLSYV